MHFELCALTIRSISCSELYYIGPEVDHLHVNCYKLFKRKRS